MLVILPAHLRQLTWMSLNILAGPTEIKIATSACVQTQGCVACGAVLRFEFADVFIKAGFVGYV